MEASAWSWTIEALAIDPRVDVDYLCDVIEFRPDLARNLHEAAREMVAMRTLEELFDPAKMLNDGVTLPSDQEEIQFDSSEFFTQVLKRVVDKASLKSLRKDGPSALRNIRKRASDKLVRGVCAFVEKKKTSLPKCALKELSDILQNGDPCQEKDLERIKTCLLTQEGTVDDQSCELPPEKKQKRDNNVSVASTEKIVSPLISSDMQGCPIDVQRGKSLPGKELGHDNNGLSASAKQNLAPLISHDLQCPVDALSGMSPNGSISSTEKNAAPVILSGMQDCQINDCNDLIASTEKISNPLISSHINPSTPPDSEELNVCMKCGRGGEILVCSVGSCSVIVHERCLGFTKSVDDRGEFLCPYCACSSAKSECAAAKEKMLLARQMLSLFVGGNSPRQSSDESTGKAKGVDQIHQASSDEQPKCHLAPDNVHTSPPNCPSRETPAKSCQFEKRFILVDTDPPRQSRHERIFEGKGKGVDQVHRASSFEQQKGHLTPDHVPENRESLPEKSSQFEKRFILVDAKSPSQGNDERTFEGIGVDQVHLSSTDEEQEDEDQMMPIEQIHYTGVRTQQEYNSPSKNTSCASSDKLYGTPGTKNQTAKTPDKSLTPKSQRKLDDQMQGASSATNHDSDGNLEEENPKAPTSKFPQEVKIMYNRRMRVPWTEEEVEMLKEGMKRFGSNMTIIPWSTILEFGSTVFWKGRTGVDLKDKWRNMLKANPEVRQG